MKEFGLYKLFENIIEKVWQYAMMDEGFSSLDDTLTLESFFSLKETIKEPSMESVIDSFIAVDEEYQYKVLIEGFSQQEVLTIILLGFSITY